MDSSSTKDAIAKSVGLEGTYADNTLSVAVVHAMLNIIEDEKLCERSQYPGKKLVSVLNNILRDCPANVDIRVKGAVIAVEFNDPITGKLSAEITKNIQSKL
ncbi:aminotransferase class III-fold pyridoxal phosphate-dependent enzyme [Rouxiella sp. T17]|uniref:aminotransferase class III-fold pyridoxal phosphate-dependent enzyme n=1 Tax=Rouxiella sp. T17 TaxID=3085684 RepID=UPI002FC6B86D